MSTFRFVLLFGVAVICSLRGNAQTVSCDQSLLRRIAVQGINPAWAGEHMYSTTLIPSIGFATTDMASAIDPTVANYMNLYGIPGGAVAMSYKGNLIFAKSYGYVDAANAVFGEPDSRFRLASVSKALTAMGIMKLVHDGLLTLNSHPFPFAGVGTIIAGTPGNFYYAGASTSQNPNYNSQLSQISVNDMLHHAGGWSRDNGGPDLESYQWLQPLASFLSQVDHTASGPPDCTTLMSFVESQPLQVPPAKETHYSNVGFCALSELIRETSGVSYLDYMSTNVFAPLGMRDTTLGATQQSGQLDRESVYYDINTPGDAGDAPQASLFPPYAVVPAPYSGIGSLEAQEGAGGIVSTAIDLALFAGAIASGNLPNLPGSGWPQEYYTDSANLPGYECVDPGAVMPNGTYPVSDSCTTRGISAANEPLHSPYGSGWDMVQPNVVEYPLLSYNNYNFTKDGGYQGTVSSLVTTGDGYGFAAVFNQNDNTIPGPEGLLFWPGCAAPAPLPASSSGNCALQAAYNHASAQPWIVDFSAQFSQDYSIWMNTPDFETYLAAQEALGLYPSRLEGREVPEGVLQYRGRFAPQPGNAVRFLYGQTCPTVLAAVESAAPNTPLVSLQRFDRGDGSFVYQAVWSAPVPQLPVPGPTPRDFAGNGRAGALLYDSSLGESYTALSSGNGTYKYAGNLFTPGFDTLRTGDFNGDGKADLVLYNSHTALAYIGMGNGDGTFKFQSLFWSPGFDFVETGDLNGDGKTDFALYNSSTGTMYTAISNGTGEFSYKYTLVSKGFTTVRLADFNGDGKADVLLYRATDGAAFLGIGDGAGGFTFKPLFISAGYNLIDIGDLNGDGKADMILYNPVTGNAATGISDGSGEFAFTPMIFSPGFTSVRLSDYTGDGLADVTVYNKNTAAAYFGTGTGAGTFNFQSLFWSPDYDYVVPEDVNGDGKTDVILYNSAAGTEYTGISNGDGTFAYTYQYWGIGKLLAQ